MDYAKLIFLHISEFNSSLKQQLTMNLYFRFIALILKRLVVKNPIDPFSHCTSKCRVNLLDLDFNMHMNNGRYLSIMDLGRFDLMLKSKIFWKIFKQGYYPVVSSQSIRFKKSLGFFMSFDLVTLIESWDERNLYIHQQFIKNDVIYAEGYVKTRFRQRGRKESVPTKEIFELLGVQYQNDKVSELAKVQKNIEGMLVQDQQ